MNISKARLIQIIKEELAQEAAPGSEGAAARDLELSESPREAGMDFMKTREDLERMIGNELISLLGKEGK
jgi:hypothetical protein